MENCHPPFLSSDESEMDILNMAENKTMVERDPCPLFGDAGVLNCYDGCEWLYILRGFKFDK